ncbi:DUF2637 domain-containing protein [Planomonospora sp. ID67723]|uniref:DUF2637 domain-containing protein n=1 Tax=Planomonospora sp. ID67723 TaxID=2738134 RepID=UPI0018C3DDD5|nr:DUF2637 domain-containing protein [Planomonospora sp. ID67723]MBG0827626.1 DUF2637 domain-containing protein [Planomonospora sp. ID67723]
MDVKSPAAAGSLSRPSSAPPAPAERGRAATALRHAGVVLAGIGVAALTGAACVLSFENLRALAVLGEARPDLAYLYPAGFDALLVVTMISVLLLRGGRWPVRVQAGLVLTLLLAAAAAVEVITAVRVAVDVRQAAVVVAVAPWVMLTVALWLWLLLIKHAHTRRTALDAHAAGHGDGRRGHGHDGRDIVPFPEAEAPTAEYPARPDTSPQARPAPGSPAPHATAPDAPAHVAGHPAAEVVLDPRSAPPMESAPHHDLPAVPVVGPTPAPETPEVDEIPEPPGPAEPAGPAVPAAREAGDAAPDGWTAPRDAEGPEHSSDPGGPEEGGVEAAGEGTGETQEEQDRPVRWGDLVRPRRGDLLVHPPRAAGPKPDPESRSRVSERVETWDAAPEAAQEPAQENPAEVTGYGDDTQPMRTLDLTDSPDPAHGSEAADLEEGSAERHRPYPDDDDVAPPSGRMRSTPTPPEE